MAQSQYSTVIPMIGSQLTPAPWMSEDDRERISAYIKYDEIYWSEQNAFKLMRRGTEQQPVYVPNPRTIVDSTSHYLLKGLTIEAQDSKVKVELEKFLKREKFMSRFMVAKHTGVNIGDWCFHITADEELEDGKRISLTAVEPHKYFPVPDPDDLDKIIKVHLAEHFKDPTDNKDALRRLTYAVVKEGGTKRITVEENVYYLDRVWRGPEPPLKRVVKELDLLPEAITAIPVYHFKNADWSGQDFGSSELRGYERIFSSVNQTLTDEELALALEGLGVYATDAGKPEDEEGNEVDWEIGPGRVAEVPLGSFFKRVEGVNSVTPMLDHAKYLDSKLMESSGTFLAGSVDVQVAQSGIALAIRFLPTAAKLEERDTAGIDVLQNMWYDWTFWMDEFEGTSIEGKEVDIKIGEKLPMDRQQRITELNNMHDRDVISTKFYRSEMEKLGYTFPANMDEEIDAENQKKFEDAQKRAMLTNGDPNNPNAPTDPAANDNKSNNRNKPNESKGTEASHTGQRQQRPPNGRKGG